MEGGKIPPYVWAIAAAVVVVIALLARRSAGQSAPIVVTNPASDTAIQSGGDTDRARIAAQLGAFSALANTIGGVTQVGTVAQRDVAVTSLSTQAASYAAAVDSVTEQVRNGYQYWGVLAQEGGATQRARIGADAAITITGIESRVREILGLRQADSDDLYTREQGTTARYIADEETERAINHDRTSEAIANDDNRTRRYGFDVGERTYRYGRDIDLDISQEEGQTARYIAKKGAGNWYDPITRGIGDFIGGGGILKFFGF
jgi:hypothetical protein